MGLWEKLTNFVLGKGWKSKEELVVNKSVKPRATEAIINTTEVQTTTNETKKDNKTEETSVINNTDTYIPVKSEIEDNIVKEKITEPVEEIKPVLKVTTKKKSSDVDRIVKNYKFAPSIAEFENKINERGVNYSEIQLNQPLNYYYNTYKDVLLKNGKLSDPDIMGILIENREKLRHRFNMIVRIFLNNDPQHYGVVYISKVLAEDNAPIHKYAQIGSMVDGSHGLVDIIDNIKSAYSYSSDVSGAQVKTFTGTKQISNVTIDFGFA